MSQKISRRQFLAFAAASVGATTITCTGLGAIAFHRPVAAQYQKLATNRNATYPKVLVTYATRAGSTMEVARAIAMELEQREFSVDICPIKQVSNLEGYNHIVIGSAIRMSAPLPEVMQFIETHRSEFQGIPLEFFAVHLQNDGDDEASRKARLAYLDPIHKLISPHHEAFFTGVYDPEKVSYIERLMGKTVQTPIGDFRDWAAIKEWGQALF